MTNAILGLVGSPRRGGNTDVLVSAMLDAAREQGAAVESLYLNDLTIRECTGCHACWAGKPCPLDDDMLAVYPKIVAADAVIFGTPVYWYGPTALMKACIDRLVYFNCPDNHVKIAGKAAVLVVPYEDADDETVAPLLTFFQKCFAYLEMRLVGQVVVPGVTARGEVRDRPGPLAQARKLGQELARRATGGFP